MASIYAEALDLDTPKLARILYREIDPTPMIGEMLRAQLHRPKLDAFFRVVFDDSHGNQSGSPMSKSILILLMPHSQSSNMS